ncbi:MAG: 6-phosphogluconolactonase [Betaproteobacteria bacterium]
MTTTHAPQALRNDRGTGVSNYTFIDSATQAESLAADVARLLRAAIAERGTASLIVSGGRSPTQFFEALSTADLAWRDVTVSLTDERLIDTATGESNERLVRTHLLINAARDAHFVSLRSAVADAGMALADRNRALLRLVRPFDVLVLGMGVDGHTASMFAGADGLAAALDPAAAPALVGLNLAGDAQARISLNRAALLDSRCICLLIQGREKREVLARACDGTPPEELPVATIVQQRQVPVHVYWSP